MTVTQTSTGYVVALDTAEHDQVLIALELAAACRRGEEGRGALIRLVDTAAVAALADRLTPAECAPATRPIRGDEAARWRVTGHRPRRSPTHRLTRAALWRDRGRGKWIPRPLCA